MYRLNGLTLLIPPLRERTAEIPALAETFVTAACEGVGRSSRFHISPAAMQHLVSYGWPGNVRELRNMMERAVALCDGDTISPEHLPLEKMRTAHAPDPAGMPYVRPTTEITRNLPPLSDATKLAERQRVVDALVASNGNQTRAAQLLGISRRTFVSKLDQYQIPRPQKGSPSEETDKVLT
jgi:two-component system response regulator AtoC